MPATAAEFSHIPAEAIVDPTSPVKMKFGIGQLKQLSSYYHENLSKEKVEARALTELDTSGHDVTADESDGSPDDSDSEYEERERRALEDLASKMEGEEKAATEKAFHEAKAKAEERARRRARAGSGQRKAVVYDPTALRVCGYQTTWSKDIFSFFVYILFVAAFCVAILGRGTLARFDYNNALKQHLVDRLYMSSDLRLMSFNDMKTKVDWFEYMDSLLLPTLFPSPDSSPAPTPSPPQLMAGDLGILLGSLHVRQVRVESDSCVVAKRFEQSVSRCDAKLTPDDEEVAKSYVLLGEGGERVEWRSDSSLNTGFLELYSFESKRLYENGGYVVPLTATTAAKVMSSLRDSSWLDSATRLVAVEFVAYSPASGLLSAVRLAAEVMPSGDVLPLAQIGTFDEWLYWRTYSGETENKAVYASACFEVILYALNAAYTLQELGELLVGGADYFKSNHNLIELFGCAALNAALACRVLSFKQLLVIIPSFAESPLPELGSFPYYSDMAISLQCIVSLVVFAKFFKIFKFHRTLNIFFETMSLALNKVIAFIIVMFVFFLAYALAFHIAFGHIDHSFMDFPESLFSLFLTVLGYFDIRRLMQSSVAARTLGPVLFSTFIVVNLFLLLSMMFAMIKLSYDTVLEKHFAHYLKLPKKNGKRKKEAIPPLARDLARITLSWLRLLNRLKACCKLKKMSVGIDLDDEANTRREKALARIIMGTAGIEEVMKRRAIMWDREQEAKGPQAPGTRERVPSFRSFRNLGGFSLLTEVDDSAQKESAEKEKKEKADSKFVENPKLDLLVKIVEAETAQKAQLASIDFLGRLVRAKAFALVNSAAQGAAKEKSMLDKPGR